MRLRALLTLVLPLLGNSWAATHYIGGTVTDGAGVPVMNARVTLRECGGLVPIGEQTGSAFGFMLSAPLADCYELTATAKGFKRAIPSRVVPSPNGQAEIRLVLQLIGPPAPKSLPGAPEFDQLADYFRLDLKGETNLLVTTHRPGSTQLQQGGAPSAFGLWKATPSRFVFVRRFGPMDKQWAQPFRFDGRLYIRFLSIGGHGLTDDEIFRVGPGGALTPVDLVPNTRPLQEALRPGEVLGFLYYFLSDDHLELRTIACSGSGACFPGDSTADLDRIKAQLTITGDQIRISNVVRLTAAEAARTH
jgi:hypothetical protein